MRRKTSVFAAFILIISLFSGCTGGKDGVTIGSKQFTENVLLGEIYADLIEAKTDIPVNRKLNLGGTSVCVPAMEKGEIDIYFEYTGTAYNEILDHTIDADTTPEQVLETCKKELNDKGITMFDPLGLNNTYALAIKASRQTELGVSSISDLSPISDTLKFGAGHQFYSREHDGYNGIVETYDLKFKESLKMDTSLLYEAVDKGDVDVIVVFGTDSLLKKYDLTILKDDKVLFPPYQGTPICKNETLTKYPELKEVLNTLKGAVDDETIRDLNYKVDVEKKSVEEVAREYLESNGYIRSEK